MLGATGAKTMNPLTGWDGYDAYLFDIDGTLLHCTDAVHYFAFCHVLTALAGRPINLDGVIAHGNTDTGILRDALRLAGVPDAQWRPQLPWAYSAMCAYVERSKAELRPVVLPHVQALLEHLYGRGALLGIATGNLAGIGNLKLSRSGLLEAFGFFSYSDGIDFRSEVFAAGLLKARALAGARARVCAVGDTPADIEAAHANGLDVIAVATGIYSREQLLQYGPTMCMRDFGEMFRSEKDNKNQP